MTSLFGELTGGSQGQGLFPDDYLHLGGDEVDTSCWTETPHIAAWLTANNYTADQAYMYAVERAHQIVLAQGRQPVNWEEVFNHFGSELDNSTIVHIWLDHATLAKVVAAGYRGILSNQDVWYLDHLDVTWQQFYTNDPLQAIDDPNHQKLVLGGEVCMWGETVDGSEIFSTVWPRAAAAAERLWSPQHYSDVNAAADRISSFRCLLNRRGIGAAPTSNPSARQGPPGPGGCNQQ
jgi:hexosaminidase